MGASISAVRLDETFWGITSNYFSRKLIEHAKAVPGMHFEKNIEGHRNVWVGYVDAVVATAARLNHDGIRVEWDTDPPTPESWRESRTPYVFAAKELRPYQVEGVRFLLARARSGALLADAMRLGKSRQGITAARAFKQKTIILCPPHVVGVWSRGKDDPSGAGEVALGWPNAKVGRLVGIKSSPLDTSLDVIVGHFDLIYAWVEELLKWGADGFTLIIDEIHLLAGYASKRNKAIEKLRASATRAIGLSGTPMSNNPHKFHNALSLISPKRFGFFFLPPDKERPNRPSYARIYCDSKQETVGGRMEEQKTIWRHDGATNLDEPDGQWILTKAETLHARVAHLMLRRLKKDVDPELPQKTRQIIDVVIPARAMIGVSEQSFASSGEGLRQILNLAADGKLKSVVDLIVNHLLEGEKVVCFCYRRAFAERVAKDVAKKMRGVRDFTHTFVHGGVTQRERDLRIQSLRKHEGTALLSCTIDTTSTGIDLSFAQVAVVAEFSWEPHELMQLEERLYKYGAGIDAKSLIQYVVGRGSGDELIVRGLLSKLDTFERVIGETGDGLKEDLAAKKAAGLKVLYEALLEQRRAAPAKKKKAKVT